MGEERGLDASVRDLRDTPVGSVLHVEPAAIRLASDGHVFIKRFLTPMDMRLQWARVEVHRTSETEFKINVPWRVQYRWAPVPDASSGGIQAAGITHHPLPWSRGVMWATQRSRVARVVEDWLSARSRSLAWAATGIALAMPFALAAMGAAIPQIAIFSLIWGVSNVPQIHSAITALWTRDGQRFAQPGLYLRPWETDELRAKDRRLAEAVLAGDVLPTALHYRPRGLRPKRSPVEHVKSFFSDMLNERSTVPQFSMTMAVTAFGFIMKHFVASAVFDPVPILIGSWAVGQASTIHSFYAAFQMKRHGATWYEVKNRIFHPTAARRPESATLMEGRNAYRVFAAPEISGPALAGAVPSNPAAAPPGAPSLPESAVAGPLPGSVKTSLLGPVTAPVATITQPEAPINGRHALPEPERGEIAL